MSNDLPTFNTLTVVIPVFNRADMLRACLDSVAAQTVRAARVIVVDDGSSDDSADVALCHALKPDVITAPHAGATAARNVGLDAVNTEWTMFFDSDDLMEPDHIANAMGAPLDNADIVGWDVLRCAPDGSKCRLPFEIRDIAWHNLMHGTLATQRYMARTQLFRKAGGWNPDVPIWNDIELGTRLLALNPRVVKAENDRPTVRQIVGAESITGPSWASRIDRFEASLAAMAATLGDDHADWIALKRAILAADIAREDAAAGRDMYRRITPRTAAIRFAYNFRRLGGRGAARLLRPFFTKTIRP